jgi:hypothetical protein
MRAWVKGLGLRVLGAGCRVQGAGSGNWGVPLAPTSEPWRAGAAVSRRNGSSAMVTSATGTSAVSCGFGNRA